MSEQFSRTEMLLGEEALKKLASSKVAVFGVGGVGGYTVEALTRCGVGELDLIDNDVVNISNLNRQIYALNSTLGLPKVEVAKQRCFDINPDVKINIYQTFYSPETKNLFNFSKYDYIVDAIDTVTGKISLVEEAKKANVPIICAMGAGNKLNPAGFEVADISKTSVCPLAKVMRGELKKRNIKGVKVVYSKEPPIKTQTDSSKRVPGSTSFVPPVVGMIIAGEVIKDLIK